MHRADVPERDAPTGEIVGPFEVLACIGDNAMGRVCRARQVSLNRVVALKLLDDRLARDQVQVKRFLREARAAAAIRHPNVAGLIDVGTCPTSGKHFIAFELIQGPSVEALLSTRGRLPEAEALTICLGMAEALTCLEQHGLVHRDLQPSNILLADDGTPKMIDLGLAKRLDETGSITVGAFLTTPHYVAPEQAMALEQLDSRADVYALGVTLFQCVTGALPFAGDDFLAIVTRHVNEDVPDPRGVAPDVSEGISRLVSGLCARNRDQRYTPRAAVLDLRRALDGEPPLGPDAAAAAVSAGELRSRSSGSARVQRPDLAEGEVEELLADSRSAGSSHTDLLGGVAFKLVLSGPDGAVSEHEFDQPVVTIGREPRCDLHIDDKTVSRRHAELLRNGPTFALSAHQTANGTFLNERPVSELAIVTPSDEVRIAEKFRLKLIPLARQRSSSAGGSRAERGADATDAFRQGPAGFAPTGQEEKTSELEVTPALSSAASSADFDPYRVDPPRLEKAPVSEDEHRSPLVSRQDAPAPRPSAPAPRPASGAPLSGLGAPGLPSPRRPAEAGSDRLRPAAAPRPAAAARPPAKRDEPTSNTTRRPLQAEAPPHDSQETDDPTDLLRRPPGAAPAAHFAATGAGRAGVVVFSKGPDEQRVEVTGSFKLGKAPECDLVLKHPHAPRKAALIVRGLDGCTLYNVAPSPNTVTVNGKPVADEVLLCDGDQVSVYGTTLTYQEQ